MVRSMFELEITVSFNIWVSMWVRVRFEYIMIIRR